MAGIGAPDVLLLDEPYQGFDRGTYLDFWHQLDGWRAEGKAIVVVPTCSPSWTGSNRPGSDAARNARRITNR